MSRIVLLIILVSSLVSADDHQLEAKLKFIENIDDFKSNNPQLVLYPLNRAGTGKKGIIYSVGQRRSGDRLVSQLAENNQWESLKDVALTVTYPASGSGYVVTYVQININQVKIYFI